MGRSSACADLLYVVLIVCHWPFPVWCLGQNVEFDCIGYFVLSTTFDPDVVLVTSGLSCDIAANVMS